jgi:hypothetical protein
MRGQGHKDVVATKGTRDTKVKNTKTMGPLDAPPACAQANPSSGRIFVGFALLNFVLFVLFVLFVAPDLRALDRERSE